MTFPRRLVQAKAKGTVASDRAQGGQENLLPEANFLLGEQIEQLMREAVGKHNDSWLLEKRADHDSNVSASATGPSSRPTSTLRIGNLTALA